ncbi:MAG TPA: hypothetical protein VMS64_12485 [Candidatus Methylomirabilis sp.]|nr:hypothetical protein [Candidatus Methylomirabilis sp.]
MVAVLVGGLIAGAAGVTPAGAQAIQGGIGDPLTLAASGVVVPFFTSGNLGGIATLQVASPVGANPDTHLFFYRADCSRIPVSAGLPLTTNDIGFIQIADIIAPFSPGLDGLVTLAKASQSGFTLIPLDNPVHARLYQFSTADGRSRVLESIILNTAEFPSVQHWWSPLRTGATFFAPLQTAAVATDLYLICPLATIVGNGAGEPAAFGNDTGGGTGDLVFTTTGFPQINPRLPNFPGSANNIRVRIYDDHETFLRDFLTTCTCVTKFESITKIIAGVYDNPALVPNGSYTELTVARTTTGINSGPTSSFTGYTSTFTVGSATNAFFARIQNGSQASIDGPAVVSER